MKTFYYCLVCMLALGFMTSTSIAQNQSPTKLHKQVQKAKALYASTQKQVLEPPHTSSAMDSLVIWEDTTGWDDRNIVMTSYELFKYDEEGKQTLGQGFYMNDEGDISPEDNIEYNYNASDKLESIVESYYNSETKVYVLDEKMVISYDENNKIKSITGSYWEENAWVEEMRTDYIYNEIGMVSSTHSFDISTAEDMLYAKEEFYYADNNLSDREEYYYDWEAEMLVPEMKYSYTYNTGNQVTEVLMLYYADEWMPVYRQGFVYSTEGVLEYAEMEENNEGVWDSEMKYLMTYQATDNNLIIPHGYLEDDFTRIIFSNGMLTQVEFLSWGTSDWVEAGYAKAYYVDIETSNKDVINAQNGLTVYPNPVSTELFIQSDIENPTIKVYNILGEEILTQELTQKSIDVAKLQNGIYFLRLEKDGLELGVKRFVKR